MKPAGRLQNLYSQSAFFSGGFTHIGAVMFFLHVHAAVDLDDLAGNIAGHVGSQEGGNIGDVLGLSAATERYFLAPFGANVIGKCSSHGCFDEARGNGVGTDAAAAHFLSHTLGEGNHTSL